MKCNGSSARLGIRGRTRVRAGVRSREFGIDFKVLISTCRVRVAKFSFESDFEFPGSRSSPSFRSHVLNPRLGFIAACALFGFEFAP